MSKICKNCGEELDDSAVFCCNCKHNPDEEKKKKKSKKKLILIIFVIAVVIGVAVAVIIANSAKGMKFVRVGEIDSVEDEKTRELLESLSYLEDCDEDDYICILTDDASGEVKVPARYKDGSVVYVTAFPNEGRRISELYLTAHTLYLEHICSFEDDCDTLRTVNSPEKTYCLSDCFNRCPSLEKAYFNDVRNMKHCFCDCPSLDKIAYFFHDTFEDYHYAVESSYCNCDALENVRLYSVDAFSDCFNSCGSLETVELDSIGSVSGCFCDCGSLRTVRIPHGITQSISESFLDCGAIENVSIDVTVGSVVDSFNDCDKLEELSLPKEKNAHAFNHGYIHSFENAFNGCDSLKTLDLERGVNDVIDSFNDCPRLSELTLPESVSEIQNAFNRCGSLTSLDLDIGNAISDSFDQCSSLDSLRVMISDYVVTRRIADAFNGCSKLKTFTTNANLFENALNDCTSLKTVNLKSRLAPLKDSFKNCPVDVASIKSDEEIKYEKEQEEARKLYHHTDDLEAIIDEAWQKLADSGAIDMEKDSDGKRILEFDEAYSGGERCDQLRFNDPDVAARLLSEPDPDLQQVVLMDGWSIYSLSDTGDVYAEYYDECRYIIAYESHISLVKTNYYQKYVNGIFSGFVDREDMTTLVYIVDVKKKEIAAIHSVGTSVPPDQHPAHHYGSKLDNEARDYIRTLLE